MAHRDWCGLPCADCLNPCSLDQSIPCSPDCELLLSDGSRDTQKCKAAGCDVIITRIAVIDSSFVRDTQIFLGSFKDLEESENILNIWEKHGYADIDAPDLFAGIITGISEDEMKSLVIAQWGVHPDAVTLLELI